MEFNMIFSYNLIHAMIRSATPILFAGLAATITNSTNILNVGIEGTMLIGAFIAVAVSFTTGSWLLGVLAAICVGVLVSGIISLAHLKYGGNIFAVGTTINIFALAVTKFGLNTYLKSYGSFSSPDIDPIPNISIGFLSKNPVIDSIFNNYSILELFAIILVIVMWFVLYKTVWGLQIRSVGLNPMAAQSSGVSSLGKQVQTLLISGAIAGIGGAYISLGYTTQFVENMTGGRGFMGIAAMFFGGGNPINMWMGSLVFGFSDSLAARLQSLGFYAQFVLMVPYVATILVFALSMYRQMRREKKRKSAI